MKPPLSPPVPPVLVGPHKCEMYALDFQSVPAVTVATQPRPDMTPGQFNKILRLSFASRLRRPLLSWQEAAGGGAPLALTSPPLAGSYLMLCLMLIRMLLDGAATWTANNAKG